jgi:Leucine-rich repeat (LRR) protein
MKKIILSIILLITFQLIHAQIVTIPDTNFKTYLLANTSINTNGDNEIQTTEAAVFTGGIYVSNLNIADLTGVEAFSEITELYCDNNSLINLDLSNNTELTLLLCNNNALTSLNVSNNTLLEILNCYNNALTSLNVSNNTELGWLRCQNNSLTNLNVSANTILNTLLCQNNLLIHLDISNTEVTNLNCSNNQLISLNIANGMNTDFEDFHADINNLTCIEVDDAAYAVSIWTNNVDNLVSFSQNCLACTIDIPDVNFKTYLIDNEEINVNGDGEIQCSEAYAFTGTINAANLSISDLKGIEHFVNLPILYCNNNVLLSVDLRQNIALTELRCNNNLLTELNLSQNILLSILRCYQNSLANLNLNQNTALTSLWCPFNNLTHLDLTQNTALTDLRCRDNQLLDLDLTVNTALTFLRCSNNSLTTLNVANGNNTNFTFYDSTNNPNLSCIEVDNASWSTTNWTNVDATSSFNIDCANAYTYVPDNNFEQALIDLGYDSGTLDDYVLTANINSITVLDVNNKGITDLTGIQDFVSLNELKCYSNVLATIDVSTLTNLTYLHVGNTSLTTIDVSQLTNLTYLGIGSNSLTTIDVSALTNLTDFNIDYNSLTTIDVSQLTNLTSLHISNNSLITIDVSTLTNLTDLNVRNNSLTTLNVANGNNTNFTFYDSRSNPDLSCIIVDDASWSTSNWTQKDATATFVNGQAACDALYINETVFEENLTLYPNPTKDYIYIEETVGMSIASIVIYNTLGQKLKYINNVVERIDMTPYAQGLYIIKLISIDKQEALIKVIKK